LDHTKKTLRDKSTQSKIILENDDTLLFVNPDALQMYLDKVRQQLRAINSNIDSIDCAVIEGHLIKTHRDLQTFIRYDRPQNTNSDQYLNNERDLLGSNMITDRQLLYSSMTDNDDYNKTDVRLLILDVINDVETIQEIVKKIDDKDISLYNYKFLVLQLKNLYMVMREFYNNKCSAKEFLISSPDHDDNIEILYNIQGPSDFEVNSILKSNIKPAPRCDSRYELETSMLYDDILKDAENTRYNNTITPLSKIHYNYSDSISNDLSLYDRDTIIMRQNTKCANAFKPGYDIYEIRKEREMVMKTKTDINARKSLLDNYSFLDCI
jgi:hypothetical protein